MTQVTLKGNAINTIGTLPAKGTEAVDFQLVKNDLSIATLSSYTGKKVLNIFPSIDTPTCALSVKNFNQNAAELAGVSVLNISMDLPFAQSRFCGANGIDKVDTLSGLNSTFGTDYQVAFTDGPLKGLYSRAIIILDENNKVLYTEQVAEIADEPNYAAALAALK